MEKSVLMVARAVSDLTGCSNDLFDFGDASAKHQFCSEERWDVGADESLDHNESAHRWAVGGRGGWSRSGGGVSTSCL
jgi:hypothetical protein